VGQDGIVGTVTTGWKVQGSNRGGGKILCTCPD